MDASTITSVGIDIGTSTTSMVVSRLAVANTASGFTAPHVAITGAEIVYRSEIYPTPQASGNRIDVAAVASLIEREYGRAGITPADVQTGAVIITGESSRKENAELVTESMSELAGEFVVASAGPDLESIIAAKGAGAQDHSREFACTVANVDVGGGTSNIAVFHCGDLVSKACWDIGGRLVRVDGDGRMTYVSPRIAAVARDLGIELAVGERADAAVIRRVTDRMAALLAEALGLAPRTPLCDEIRTPEGSDLVLDGGIDCVSFSGGVSEAVYRPHTDWFRYGDIGPILAASLREGLIPRAAKLIEPRETIRATVVGAGSYTTTVSGSTIEFTDEGLFPMKNLPAFFATEDAERAALEGDGEELARQAAWYLGESAASNLVFCINRVKRPGYATVCRLADALVRASAAIPEGEPLLVLVEDDFAKVLGQALRRRLPDRRLICIDSIQAIPGDYLDLGRPLMGGLAIPVVVKTLIFG
ncbi:ethanolamine ammonia-lyase reactivating factor EutA [Candidatus Collinsella stercoripullorum]|uniref:ethanolamine ammonia-lyase reactivating factor EutA n=1 Tax=Candidatus Collinsella stercoripullorum TaxID=2838522 RepID=UPI0022DF5449|nr:ethanolamine ammonia-lyase reactivating factor EutA [Candidatus Collinsella stercoripullorum]